MIIRIRREGLVPLAPRVLPAIRGGGKPPALLESGDLGLVLAYPDLLDRDLLLRDRHLPRR